MDIKQFAAEIFDVFTEICKKYNVKFDQVETAVCPDVELVSSKVTPGATIKKGKKAKRIIAPEIRSEFIKWFINTPAESLYAVKRDQWKCVCDEDVWQLQFASKCNRTWSIDKISGHILAFKAKEKNITFVNAGRFTYQGRGRNGVTLPQSIGIDNGAMPIPLRLITADENPPKPKETYQRAEEAGLGAKVSDISVIDWKGPETFKVLRPRWGWRGRDASNDLFMDRHFAGAMLLKIKDDYYLIDVDRNEIKVFNFIAFFTNLPKGSKPTTVEEAYAILEPKEVRSINYVRQGELFFIPVDDNTIKNIIIKNAGDPKAKYAYDNIMSLAQPHALFDYNKEIKERAAKFEPDDKDTSLPKLSETEKDTLDNLLKVSVPAGITKSKYEKDMEGQYSSPTKDELQARLPVREVGDDEDSEENKKSDAKLGIKLDHSIQLRDMTARESHKASLLLQDGDKVYVWGHIGHREHNGLFFDKWHQAYRNTASRNFNVSGEID